MPVTFTAHWQPAEPVAVMVNVPVVDSGVTFCPVREVPVTAAVLPGLTVTVKLGLLPVQAYAQPMFHGEEATVNEGLVQLPVVPPVPAG